MYGSYMGWWPFAKKKGPVGNINDPLLKDHRTWLSELRDVCEMNFDSPEEARRRIRHMQVEWKECLDNGTLSDANREGLESRAYRLLTCSDDEWMTWLDDLEFWKVGWKPDSGENSDA